MFLLCFSRANTLTPYSKSVPAVIAKASAIYNPIIYAIIHPRYRYSKHIIMSITVHTVVVFTMNELHSFLHPYPMQCVLLPWSPHDGIQIIRALTASIWYRASCIACGAPDVALGVANRGEWSLSSLFFPLTTRLCPVELHNTVTDIRRSWYSGSSFAISGTATIDFSRL